MTHVDVEGMQRAARTLSGAAEDAHRAAGRIEESVNSLNLLFGEGYDSNALRLLSLLSDHENSPVTALLHALTTLNPAQPTTTQPAAADAHWLSFPAHTPATADIYITDCGALFWDDGVWLTPVMYNGWEPDDTGNVTRFLQVNP